MSSAMARGYSRFEHVSHGISLALLQYVPPDDPIKISEADRSRISRRSRVSRSPRMWSGCWAPPATAAAPSS